MAKQFSGISQLTTLPAPMVELFPIDIPPFKYTFEEIQTLFPNFIGFDTIENFFFDSSYSIIFELIIQFGAKNTLFPAEKEDESINMQL